MFIFIIMKKNGLTIFAIVLIVCIDEQIFKGPYYYISDHLLPPCPYIYVTLKFSRRILKLNLYKVRIVAFVLHFLQDYDFFYPIIK